jgi:hypothetical protein
MREILTQGLLSAVLFLASWQLVAAPPATITYQGTLASAAGAPIDATLNIEFKLFDTALGGSALWNETRSVVVGDGKFAVELGAQTPLPNELFAAPLFLAIQVQGDVEMTPRLRLSSAPYAFRARSLLRNTIHLASDGTPQVNGAALRQAVAGIVGASATNRIVLNIDAGEFDLGNTTWVVPSFVELVGAGPQATVLTSSAPGSAVQLQSNTSLASLGVRNAGAGGDFNVPTTAIEVAPSAQNVTIRSAAAHSAPPGVVQGGDVRVALRFGRVTGLLVTDVDLRAERSSSLYGIRGIFDSGSDPLEKDILLRDVRIAISAASANARGVDAFGRMELAVDGMTIVVAPGGLLPTNTLGFRTQSETNLKASRLDVTMAYAASPVFEVRGLQFSTSSQVDVSDFRVKVETGSCTVGGFINGIVFFNVAPSVGFLSQRSPQVRNGLVQVSTEDCFAGGVYASGSKPIIDNVRIVATQGGASNQAAIGYSYRAVSNGCDGTYQQPGRAVLRNSTVIASAPNGFAAAVDACVGGLSIEQSTLAGDDRAFNASNNSALAYDFDIALSRLTATQDAALATFSDASGRVNGTLIESAVAGSAVVAYIDPDSLARSTIACRAVTTPAGFVAGPACPCTAGVDCPVTP